jgi:mRNA-degrading endonuclease RelE of RelBE toxin-antitoxin system
MKLHLGRFVFQASPDRAYIHETGQKSPRTLELGSVFRPHSLSGVFQIVFNEISASEISQLGTLEQLELLDEFKVSEKDLERIDGDRFGKIEREGKTLYRFRAKDYRFYFEVKDGTVVVHRVLHKGTLSDFLFRSKMPLGEDEELAKSKHFWKLIDEGRNARRL